MKKAIWRLVVFSLMLLVGCNQVHDIRNNALSGQTQSDTDDGSKAVSKPLAKNELKQLANQYFLIQGEILSNADDETIIEFGKSFVKLYTGAVAEQQKVSFEKYISNKNLLKFTDKMLELTQEQFLQGRNFISYGMKSEFYQANLQHIEDNLCYLELQYEFKGSGTACEMLITAENKSLKLVDLYFGDKDGVDTYVTGHHVEREINDPNLWDDEEWLKGVFTKLEDFEARFGY